MTHLQNPPKRGRTAQSLTFRKARLVLQFTDSYLSTIIADISHLNFHGT